MCYSVYMGSDKNTTDFQKAFRLLFRSGDQVCVGSQYATEVGPQPISPLAEFFCINPLADIDYRSKSNGGAPKGFKNGSRADLNVTHFQNFLFEIDTIPFEQQLNAFLTSAVPWATLTSSGGKSIHGIISLETPLDVSAHTQEGINRYKYVWQQLAVEISRLMGFDKNVFDSACQNPSRLSRTPGAWRADKEKHQELLKLGKLCSAEELQLLLRNAPEFKPVQRAKPILERTENEEDMKLLIPVTLDSKLRFPKTWASSTGAGNYQLLFKNILWLIDSTGCSKSVATAYLEKYTFPYLLRTGYPIEKCYKAIDHAFAMKGE